MTDAAHPLTVVPHGSGVMRHFVGMFPLAWLGEWFVGLIATVWKLLSGGAPHEAHAGACAFSELVAPVLRSARARAQA
jgi:hypothetical protein